MKFSEKTAVFKVFQVFFYRQPSLFCKQKEKQ